MIRRSLISAAGLAVAVLALAAPAHAEPRIAWQVLNPFRLFVDPADTEVHRATWKALTDDERQHPVLSAEHALQQRHPEGWAATMFRKICWNDTRNRYICPDGTPYMNPTSHTVAIELENLEETVTVECTWRLTPHGDKGDARTVRQSCAEPLRLAIPYPTGARVAVEIGGQEVAASDIRVRDLFIVGMGDSFGSGEGNPDQPVRFSRERSADYGKDDMRGYPTRVGAWRSIGDKSFLEENARWVDQACHRSLYSYQLRAALQLAVEDPHRAVTYVGEACSGAEVTTGLFLRYKGNEWVPNPPDLSQVSFIAAAQCGGRDAPLQDLPEAYHMNGAVPELEGGLVLRKCAPANARRIDLVFVSIGGNDIGFARLLANAVIADQSLLKTLGGWFGEVYGAREAQARMGTLDERYKALNRALHYILHVPWSENDRIILTGYPGLALLGDGSRVCPDGHAGMEVLPDFRLSEKKARAGQEVAERLNDLMRRSATAHGWTFVDAHRRQFVGRGICAGFFDNAFSIADDLRLPRRAEGGWEPYNPADFQAYAARQRWFRTPNDAFMTGNFHVSPSLMQKVMKLDYFAWFQVLLASTYSGAFHPTAEGHAAIADAVVVEARRVLARYSGAPRREAGNRD